MTDHRAKGTSGCRRPGATPRALTQCFIVFVSCLTPLVAQEETEPFDHVAAIRQLDENDAKAGEKLYVLHCAACHGREGRLALNPLARRFAVDPLKYGGDPYALWKTISYGNGLMFRWDAILSPSERYQIVQHLRENILKPHNPDQYLEPGAAYFEGLNARVRVDAAVQSDSAQQVSVAPGMIDGSGGTRMRYGSFLQGAVAYRPIPDKDAAHLEETTEKALLIRLPGDQVIAYDATRLSVSGIWSGPALADTGDTHHTSYKGSRPLMPSGPLHYHHVDAAGWEGGATRFHGHYAHGDRVILHYSVGGRKVLECPDALSNQSFVRHFWVAPGQTELRGLIVHRSGIASKSIHSRLNAGGPVTLATQVSASKPAQWVDVPPSQEPLRFSVQFSFAQELAPPSPAATLDLEEFTQGGARRWPATVQTAVALGENVEGYAMDELTVPLANPYGSWMRLTGLGFLSDGRLAVCTLSGDVWLVHWEEENPHALTWTRFASGLYEPLGLEVMDDQIYVRGRDRITRLHDLNADGEADHYESFYEEPAEIGAGYHAFSYDLVRDDAGYFYYAQGAWKSPLPGAVIRVSPDGNHAETISTDFRNPNGLGSGGLHGWLTVADNPSGHSLYNGFTLVRAGGRHGFENARNVPMLVVLPASIDSSSAGLCWSDLERWGPLSGSIFHTSYSRSSVFYCRTQNLDPFPNGFAIRLPFNLQAAPMRARVNPADGQVYVAAKRGWDSIARIDGAIYRFRHTGATSHLIRDVSATSRGLRIAFASPLDPASIKPAHFTFLREPDKRSEDDRPLAPVAVTAVTLVAPEMVEVVIPNIEKEALHHRTRTDGTIEVHPAISLSVEVTARDGTPILQTVHATINALPSP